MEAKNPQKRNVKGESTTLVSVSPEESHPARYQDRSIRDMVTVAKTVDELKDNQAVRSVLAEGTRVNGLMKYVLMVAFIACFFVPISPELLAVIKIYAGIVAVSDAPRLIESFRKNRK